MKPDEITQFVKEHRASPLGNRGRGLKLRDGQRCQGQQRRFAPGQPGAWIETSSKAGEDRDALALRPWATGGVD